MEVIERLGTVRINEFRNRLDLNYDLSEAYKVGPKILTEKLSFINELDLGLRNEWYVLNSKLDRQAFLIYRFRESETFLIVNFKARSDDLIALFFKQ
jgi:hypothetical protein